ncbi:RHS repeat-associated core domain-containing protein [Streptomyces sp. S1]|uniref:RHS repeat-associated core domain-containing protein n=1 Tax=Streptomyces sp. S1 TaxID=718288 RepID=UPI0027D2CF63|nr:RHS repeat-associated core domain-containing protein [Streptomyces sp. S1]
MDRPRSAQVDHHRRHHQGPDPRGHRQHRTHRTRRHHVPPHGARPDRHHHRRSRHRIHPRTRGHTQLRAQRRQVLLLPHRRHRQRDRPGRRGGQAHPHLRLHPYGTSQNTTEAFPQPYRYAGAYLDPTGLYKMGARYYDPTLGRFTQPDPSGQEKNPYLYAVGDPINHTDPTGLSSLDGAVDALGNAGDLIGAGANSVQGDTRALWGDVAGFVVGGLAATACSAAVAAAAPPTLGTSLGATAGCYVIGWSAGQIASNAVGG